MAVSPPFRELTMNILFDMPNEILEHFTRLGSKVLPQEIQNASNVDTV